MNTESHDRPVIHKTVKPRKPHSQFLPIITFTKRDALYIERTDSYHRAEDIFSVVASEPKSLIVAHGAAVLLWELHRKFHNDTRWQFACSPIEHVKWGPNQKLTHAPARTLDLSVSFFGWRGEKRARSANRFHLAIDPITFSKRSLAELMSQREVPLDDRDALAADPLLHAECEALYMWASQVRHFCAQQGLKLRPTSGAVAGQLLRDARFYPKPRRKVPHATNAVARPTLPGNHYRLYEQEEKPFDAYYLDQTSSHHSCAATLSFPDANFLRARGRFRTLEPEGKSLPFGCLRGHGLFFLKLSIPHIPFGRFPPPWGERGGTHCHYVYSNELPLLRELGIRIESVIAAWASPTREFGLNRYARWCLEETRREPHTKHWKKPLLLATYGILAATPREMRVGYAQAKHGDKTAYPVGPKFLPVFERKSKEHEPGYANVIHRGMIEAECRLRSLALARDMHASGYEIFAVYADSVFVKARDKDGVNKPLPIPPTGWTIEHCLTDLRFHNPVSFTSAEVQKLPGIPRGATVLRASFGVRHAGKHKRVAVVT